MPEIIILNLGNTTIKVQGKNQSVLKNIQLHLIDWMHACGGKGRCTTCKMIVKKGHQNLSPLSDFENKCVRAGALKENERLACQAYHKVGRLEIEVPERSKLTHVDYSY